MINELLQKLGSGACADACGADNINVVLAAFVIVVVEIVSHKSLQAQ